MTSKATEKPTVPKPPRTSKMAPSRQPIAKPLPPAEGRWQRTKRYGWDKGGAQGGRK